jgi:HK97 family phage major capsid protein
VSSGVVEWVVVAGDPKAQVVAEGVAKPEATLTFTPVSAPLDTLAHWVQITRQALEDATYIRSVIEGKLRRGVTLAIVDQIQAAIVAATVPTATVPVGGDLIDAIRIGVGTVQSNGYNPNAVILNPADWAALDIAVMGGTLNGPTVGTNFWGLTPIASTLQAAGTALVGDFKSGVTWFDRNVSSVFISDSHADLFIRNTLVILAETRGKAAVPEPLALCECSVSATAGTRSADVPAKK